MLTWNQSEAACNRYGANLIKIDDDAEYNLLYNFYVTYSPAGTPIWVKFHKFHLIIRKFIFRFKIF